uniref:Uncharacterized protein n=1 Tax=Oryza glumipatula TaxID=40148 RepID=A0A0E0A5E9_9ORYZ
MELHGSGIDTGGEEDQHETSRVPSRSGSISPTPESGRGGGVGAGDGDCAGAGGVDVGTRKVGMTGCFTSGAGASGRCADPPSLLSSATHRLRTRWSRNLLPGLTCGATRHAAPIPIPAAVAMIPPSSADPAAAVSGGPRLAGGGGGGGGERGVG